MRLPPISLLTSQLLISFTNKHKSTTLHYHIIYLNQTSHDFIRLSLILP